MNKIIFTLMLGFLTLTMSAQLSKLSTKNGAGAPDPGSVNNPYLISTVSDLTSLRQAANSAKTPIDQPTKDKFFEMVNDINVSGSNWATIGANVNTAFKGTFDGKGFKIIGLKIGSLDNRSKSSYWGFFGRADTATIKNVSFKDVTAFIEGAGFTNIGGIVSACYNTNIINCSINGIIDVLIPEGGSGNICLGSIAAAIYRGTNIINCNSDMVLNAKSFSIKDGQSIYVGGLVAFENDGTPNSIVNSSAFGTISGIQTNTTTTPNGNPLCLGGILGYNSQGGNNSLFKVVNSFAANTIYGEAASASKYLLVSGIGNSNGKHPSEVNVSNCFSLCPSLTLKADSVSNCLYYGVKRVWRIASVPSQNMANIINLSENFAKSDMQIKTGNALTTLKISDNPFNGTSLGTTTNYIAQLNKYIANNPSFQGVKLKEWTKEISTLVDKNLQSKAK